ncbi:MAG: deoxyribonuclease V [Bacillota bacterium]
MKVGSLHPWPVTPAEAARIQRKLVGRLVRVPPPGLRVARVAGADVSFAREKQMVYAAVVALSYPSLAVLEVRTASLPATFPYVPGLLAFREGPALAEAFGALEAEPDVVLFDGHGIAHPRGLGIAAHFGLLLNRPTIGVAKSLLTGRCAAPAPERGATSPLINDGDVVGAAVRTRTGVRPVYVSPGHLMDVATAVRLVLAFCTRYRLPEPVRLAHHAANLARKSR